MVSVMQTGRTAGMQTMNEHLFDLVKGKKVEAKEAYIKSNDKAVLREMFQRENITLKLD
jgi:Tfp pilus assembly ATPase PilU